jgi:hypothetical protein
MALSVAAIEHCLACWDDAAPLDAAIPAARAQLAALVEAAGRAGALAAALAALLNGGRWSDGYGARKYALRLTGDEHAALHDLLAGDVGRGAAGARDETIEALTEVAQFVVDCRDMRAGEFRDKWGVGSWGDFYERLTGLADAALDAPRAGGPTVRGGTALLDAAARYQDAWRVLAAGDATEEAKLAHILDMHEAREDLFDATEVALRAGGAGETETGG